MDPFHPPGEIILINVRRSRGQVTRQALLPPSIISLQHPRRHAKLQLFDVHVV